MAQKPAPRPLSPRPSHPRAINPRAVAEACLCLAVRRAARAVSRRYDEALQTLGINNGQFSILLAASAEPPLGLGAVAEMLGMDRTTLTAALKPLERAGLVATRANPEDARSRLIAATEAGRALVARALPLWRQAQGELSRRAKIADPDALRAELRAMG